MIKNFKGRTTLLGIAAAVTVCGCSAGSPAETEEEDNLAQTTEAANYTEQAVETSESEPSIAQDMPVWISDEAPIEGGFVGAIPCPHGDDWFVQNMPVILYDAEPNGEGGLVPTTVVDPDGDDSSETETFESEND